MHRYAVISHHELDYSEKSRKLILEIAYERFKRDHPRPDSNHLVMLWEDDFEFLLKKAKTDRYTREESK